MDAKTWLDRCAKRLAELHLGSPRSGDEDVLPAAEIAADLMEERPYRDIGPDAAAERWMHDTV